MERHGFSPTAIQTPGLISLHPSLLAAQVQDSLCTYLDLRLGKLLGLVNDGDEGRKHLRIYQLVLEAGKVFLQFAHTSFAEVDLGDAVGQVSPLPLCPSEQEKGMYCTAVEKVLVRRVDAVGPVLFIMVRCTVVPL